MLKQISAGNGANLIRPRSASLCIVRQRELNDSDFKTVWGDTTLHQFCGAATLPIAGRIK